MEGTGGRSLAALTASAVGIAAYVGVFYRHLIWPLVVLAVGTAAGLILLGVGHLLTRRHPLASVWSIQALPIASLAIGAFVSFGAIRLGVVIRQHLDHLPKPENDALTEAISAVITSVAALIIMNMLSDRTSWLWPRRHVQEAFRRCFTRRWQSGTAAADAVFEGNVLGVQPVIRGWGWNARRRRAAVIAAALAGNGTAPFEAVTGPTQ